MKRTLLVAAIAAFTLNAHAYQPNDLAGVTDVDRIQDEADQDACDYVKSHDRKVHIATQTDENAFLKLGSEHAKERGLKGSQAEEYANTFRDSMLVMNAFSPAK
jgi:hypothetical protein